MILICKIYRKIKSFLKVNWIKTIYLNFKILPFEQARHLPIVVFGQCSISSLSGKIVFTDTVKFGIITFGHRFEIFKKANNSAEIFLEGVWELTGPAQFGYDFKLYIEKNASFKTGIMNTFANNTKIVCTNKILLGDHVKIGDESQIIDTTFHNMYDLDLGKSIEKKGEIIIGSYIAVGNRVSITKNTNIPDYSIIASNSLCNKNLNSYGNNNMFGGIPAKLIKTNYIRDWKLEEESLKNYLTIKF